MAIDKAITYLKKKAPKGEFLAYINSKEAAMLKKAGGSGELVNGIPSYRSKAGMDSKARSSSYSSPSSNPSPRGPQELGTSTRTENRITAPAATTRIGGKTYNVTPETRGDHDNGGSHCRLQCTGRANGAGRAVHGKLRGNRQPLESR